MLKPDRFSCSQKIWLKRDPPVPVTILIVELHFDLKQKQQKAKILIIPGSGVGWGDRPLDKISMVKTVLD